MKSLLLIFAFFALSAAMPDVEDEEEMKGELLEECILDSHLEKKYTKAKKKCIAQMSEVWSGPEPVCDPTSNCCTGEQVMHYVHYNYGFQGCLMKKFKWTKGKKTNWAMEWDQIDLDVFKMGLDYRFFDLEERRQCKNNTLQFMKDQHKAMNCGPDTSNMSNKEKRKLAKKMKKMEEIADSVASYHCMEDSLVRACSYKKITTPDNEKIMKTMDKCKAGSHMESHIDKAYKQCTRMAKREKKQNPITCNPMRECCTMDEIMAIFIHEHALEGCLIHKFGWLKYGNESSYPEFDRERIMSDLSQLFEEETFNKFFQCEEIAQCAENKMEEMAEEYAFMLANCTSTYSATDLAHLGMVANMTAEYECMEERIFASCMNKNVKHTAEKIKECDASPNGTMNTTFQELGTAVEECYEEHEMMMLMMMDMEMEIDYCPNATDIAMFVHSVMAAPMCVASRMGWTSDNMTIDETAFDEGLKALMQMDESTSIMMTQKFDMCVDTVKCKIDAKCEEHETAFKMMGCEPSVPPQMMMELERSKDMMAGFKCARKMLTRKCVEGGFEGCKPDY